MFIREHSLEEYWLRKRIELLEHLDNLAQEAYYDQDFNMNEDDPKLIMLKKHYKDVANPCDVTEVLKSIYPPHLYEPKNISDKQ